MGICRSCGAANDADRITCAVCGKPLVEPDENGLAALRRLASLDRPAPSTLPSTDDQADNITETTPAWLESLMARYHEAIPSFGPVATGSGSASATLPAGQRTAPRPQPSLEAVPPRLPAGEEKPLAHREGEEIPDWLTGRGPARR